MELIVSIPDFTHKPLKFTYQPPESDPYRPSVALLSRYSESYPRCVRPESEKQGCNIYVDLVDSLSKQLACHEAAAAARQGGIVPQVRLELG
jgi:hypothetical protein